MAKEGQILRLEAEDLALGYRTSCILERGYVVLEAEFELTPGDGEAIGARMQEPVSYTHLHKGKGSVCVGLCGRYGQYDGGDYPAD